MSQINPFLVRARQIKSGPTAGSFIDFSVEALARFLQNQAEKAAEIIAAKSIPTTGRLVTAPKVGHPALKIVGEASPDQEAFIKAEEIRKAALPTVPWAVRQAKKACHDLNVPAALLKRAESIIAAGGSRLSKWELAVQLQKGGK